MKYNLSGKNVWVAGHRGMVGSAVCRQLEKEDCRIIKAGREVVNLVSQAEVNDWMNTVKPDAIVLAAAKVGGIQANNNFPVDFLYENLMIEANIIHAAHLNKVERLLFLGSSCIYPRLADQPIKENSLLSGALEPTNEWYAIAKITGIKLIQAYKKQYGYDWISAMPTNLYGPGDNYDLNSSHVLPALLRKFHEAKISKTREVTVWGSGMPLREFMHCDDLANALLFLLKGYSGYEHINVGSGEEVSIRELVDIIAKVVGYDAEIVWDSSQPDGTPRKLMDTSNLQNLGWKDHRSLFDGISHTYKSWLSE
ncbi:GDP-L-fucose synthase [Amylibacter sp.]|jgi:GDP-L-fucose synthase|nr:GDP-L-fucose synthase [Amylibacter sp.]MDA9779648.1 GDP-L-fucose synthase [Amylibacter sp.]MDB9814566.1 GDP-L-fucose synthase [Amylibacter sp.]MDC1455701.1 GDP-L-fucose synthase [Amylibacter sp.]